MKKEPKCVLGREDIAELEKLGILAMPFSEFLNKIEEKRKDEGTASKTVVP